MGDTIHDFQVFAKPTGSLCNLACGYCYYLGKDKLYPDTRSFAMSDAVLETYIAQLIHASDGPEVRFSWHGGEPTLLGVAYYQKIVDLQKKHNPSNRVINNNIQTNGMLIDESWCDFLAKEHFTVGLSMDGPEELHDRFRVTKGGNPTHKNVMRAWELLTRHAITTDILCVVHAQNVSHPLAVYQFLKDINARYVGFLPIVNRDPDSSSGVTEGSVPARAFGEFLCTVFDEWKAKDIGRVLVQIFEEVARTALGQDHSLCIFRKTCGHFPVVEHNGDFYACDHFVQPDHCMGNIMDTPLSEMVESPSQQTFGLAKRNLLPKACKQCDVLALCNGGCLKDRFVESGKGDRKINYLCEGYKRFFSHCMPFVKALNQQYRQRVWDQKARTIPPVKTARNAPCPCGSGKKYKKCCMNK